MKGFCKISFLAIPILIIGYVSIEIAFVWSSALKISSNQSYCIQVEDGEDYGAVNSILDLAFMWSEGHIHHAILVVGHAENHKRYHWSHFNMSFKEGVLGNPPLFCNPEKSFLSKVDFYRIAPSENYQALYQNNYFSIPKEFNPRILPSISTLSITLPGSFFSDEVDADDCPELLSCYASMNFSRDKKLDYWHEKEKEGTRIEYLGIVHGLVKERVYLAHRVYIQYYTTDGEGEINTLIHCFENNKYQCTHIFTDGEVSYNFHYIYSDIQSWVEVQERISAQFKSFIRKNTL